MLSISSFLLVKHPVQKISETCTMMNYGFNVFHDFLRLIISFSNKNQTWVYRVYNIFQQETKSMNSAPWPKNMRVRCFNTFTSSLTSVYIISKKNCTAGVVVFAWPSTEISLEISSPEQLMPLISIALPSSVCPTIWH